jgi:hypothetical protein
VDEVGRDQLREEGGHDVGEQDDALGHGGADEVLGGGEEEDVEDVVYQAWSCPLASQRIRVLVWWESSMGGGRRQVGVNPGIGHQTIRQVDRTMDREG